MGRLFAVEIVYRGIFQKNLAKNISRGIALAARANGKMGISFGRYGDSPGGTLIVPSMHTSDALIPMAHRKETPYQLAILKGTPSFSGLWVYKDDHTDVRTLGAIAKVLPDLFTIDDVEKAILEEWAWPLKVTSAPKAHEVS